MELLEQRIRQDGIVKEGNVLKVDGFLNHRMDVALLKEMAEQIPARVVPIAEANMMMSALMPMAAPILWGGNTSKTMANIKGRTNPVPTPWIMRPARHIAKPGAKVLIREPNKNALSAKVVILRALNHFISKLEKGSTTPMASM